MMKQVPKTIFRILLPALLPLFAAAQYPPPAGRAGTTAIYRDSSAIIRWATGCLINRGFIDMTDTGVTYNGLNKASYGSYLYATGPADDLVVSLGDQGIATLGFDIPVVNGPGPDFAVFENGFGDSFLELGFVEVSSDSNRFIRFPAVSLTPTERQVSTFDTLDATKMHNLAGKYRHSYGTPFDLEDLKDSAGIDLRNVRFVRIVDVGGCLQDSFASFDAQGHKVNDPWPTPFDTGGFDLDAVGVIHDQMEGEAENNIERNVVIGPNPVTDRIFVRFSQQRTGILSLYAPTGNLLQTIEFSGNFSLDLTSLKPGFILATFNFADGPSITQKIIKL